LNLDLDQEALEAARIDAKRIPIRIQIALDLGLYWFFLGRAADCTAGPQRLADPIVQE
jgi:hypothetical protein